MLLYMVTPSVLPRNKLPCHAVAIGFTTLRNTLFANTTAVPSPPPLRFAVVPKCTLADSTRVLKSTMTVYPPRPRSSPTPSKSANARGHDVTWSPLDWK